MISFFYLRPTVLNYYPSQCTVAFNCSLSLLQDCYSEITFSETLVFSLQAIVEVFAIHSCLYPDQVLCYCFSHGMFRVLFPFAGFFARVLLFLHLFFEFAVNVT